MNDEKYFSKSWGMLTRDKGWIKPLLVMTAASLVPIVGSLGNKGYALEWSRLTAWGVDAAPKQKNVQVGKCIGSGWRAFVVDLGLGLAYLLVVGLAMVIGEALPGVLGVMVGGLLSLCSFVLSAFVGVAFMVAEIRATIYERIGAGYQINRVFDMVKADLSGFVKLFLINLACIGVASVVCIVFTLILMMEFAPAMITASALDESVIMMALSTSLGAIFVTSAIFGFIMAFLQNAIRMLTNNATALWMRQFDVPSWGRSEDPLPNSPISSDAGYDAPAPIVAERDDPADRPAMPVLPAIPVESPQVVPTAAIDPSEPSARAEVPQETTTTPESGAPEAFEVPEVEVASVDDLYSSLYEVMSQNDAIEEMSKE